MIYNLLIAAILIVAFFMCIKAYTLGLKHGKLLSNNQIPKVEVNPIKNIVEAVNTTKQAKAEQKKINQIEQGWTNIFAYDGTPQDIPIKE